MGSSSSPSTPKVTCQSQLLSWPSFTLKAWSLRELRHLPFSWTPFFYCRMDLRTSYRQELHSSEPLSSSSPPPPCSLQSPPPLLFSFPDFCKHPE